MWYFLKHDWNMTRMMHLKQKISALIVSRIEVEKTDSNQIKNRNSNEFGNSEPNPVKNGESNQVSNGKSSRVGNGGHRRTADADAVNSVG